MKHKAAPLHAALGVLMAARCSALSRAGAAGKLSMKMNSSTSSSPHVEAIGGNVNETVSSDRASSGIACATNTTVSTVALPDHIMSKNMTSDRPSLFAERPEDHALIALANLASSDVEYAKGLISCPHGVLLDDAGTCEEFNLLLDIYTPGGTLRSPSAELMPAILIVHGGANSGGDKTQYSIVASFYAKRGYVAFVPNYRLEAQEGAYPGDDFQHQGAKWSSFYPATRDVKASFRYIVANAGTYGVNVSRIAVLGVSAGAMDSLAAVATNSKHQFTTDLTLEEDPTLRTVYMEVSGAAQAVIMKSGNAWGLEAYETFSGEPALWRTGTVVDVPPLMLFHGSEDPIVPKDAADQAAHYWDLAAGQRCYILQEGGKHMSMDATVSFGHAARPDDMIVQYLEALSASPNGTAECPEP